MGSLRSVISLLLASAAGAAIPSAAGAALPWAPCSPKGYECTKLGVQLDRSGAVRGSITLDVARKPSPVPSRTAVVAIAGGPGQAAVPFVREFAQIFAPTLGDKDLLVWNQRGTGGSGPISCKALRRTTGTLRRAIRDCSLELGPKRGFYTTAQSVEDLEAIRVAAGYDQLIIYGVSYGTKVAMAYAAAHPTAVQSLILDSVVTPEGRDAFERSTIAAIPRAIGQDLCGEGACAAASPDPVGELAQLARRLQRSRLKGTVTTGKGKHAPASMSEYDLFGILLAGDLNPALRAEVPGAVRAALAGDRASILRLDARASGGEFPARKAPPLAAVPSAADAEFTLFLATTCEENVSLPWTRGAPEAQRKAEAKATRLGFAPGTFGMFSNAVAFGGTPSLCLGWSVASRPPATPGPLPDVPVLLLNGQGDLRTPLEDAQNVAARFPRAQLVAVPDKGHSVVSPEATNCGRLAILAFLATGTATACTAVDPDFPPARRPPRSLSAVPTVSGLPRQAGRTLNAFSFTLGDGARQVLGEAITTGQRPAPLGGLRSGSIRALSMDKLQFRAYEYVPGVTVTGTLDLGGARSSRFRIGGRKAAQGTVTLRPDGSARGRLGGERFSEAPRAAAAARRAGDPSLREAIASGRGRFS